MWILHIVSWIHPPKSRQNLLLLFKRCESCYNTRVKKETFTSISLIVWFVLQPDNSIHILHNQIGSKLRTNQRTHFKGFTQTPSLHTNTFELFCDIVVFSSFPFIWFLSVFYSFILFCGFFYVHSIVDLCTYKYIKVISKFSRMKDTCNRWTSCDLNSFVNHCFEWAFG